MPEAGLRQRKKQQTRQQLADTARRLFVERGFENVSVLEIARPADVAQGTVFNYFPEKEDLVFGNLEIFENELLDAIRERESGESGLDGFARFILEPRGFLTEENEMRADELIGPTRMIARSPKLLAYEQRIFERYTQRLAELLAPELRARPGDLRPYVAANAMIGVHRALIAFVRSRLFEPEFDRKAVARETRARARAALALFRAGTGRPHPLALTHVRLHDRGIAHPSPMSMR